MVRGVRKSRERPHNASPRRSHASSVSPSHPAWRDPYGEKGTPVPTHATRASQRGGAPHASRRTCTPNPSRAPRGPPLLAGGPCGARQVVRRPVPHPPSHPFGCVDRGIEMEGGTIDARVQVIAATHFPLEYFAHQIELTPTSGSRCRRTYGGDVHQVGAARATSSGACHSHDCRSRIDSRSPDCLSPKGTLAAHSRLLARISARCRSARIRRPRCRRHRPRTRSCTSSVSSRCRRATSSTCSCTTHREDSG